MGLANEETTKEDNDDAKVEQAFLATSEFKESGEALDLKRKTGDLAVYKYYFRSVGLLPMAVFMFFVLVELFAETFSSK